ncbi:MAG: hypothetical protein AUJ12_04640 [Alphaproteobacteria bacterium CG1_02_46_17]|nr:MAG: hypothetical protein AUJ12_04640 [Alphaproteobacteria bacterium CG1_02_46_17]
MIVAGMVLFMVGLTALSIPLYRLYCQITGYGGQAVQESLKDIQVLDREVTVRFNSDVGSGLPWQFKAEQGPVRVKLGQEVMVSFIATNSASEPLAGTALFNVSPAAAGKHFHKTQCFCFNYQMLNPGQTAHFPVVFYIDSELDQDSQLNDLKSVTLSYTFYRSESDELDKAQEDFYNQEK